MDKKEVKSIAIDPLLWEELRIISEKYKISMSSFISMAIVEKINRMQQ